MLTGDLLYFGAGVVHTDTDVHTHGYRWSLWTATLIPQGCGSTTCLVRGLEWALKARESPKENSCRVEVGALTATATMGFRGLFLSYAIWGKSLIFSTVTIITSPMNIY